LALRELPGCDALMARAAANTTFAGVVLLCLRGLVLAPMEAGMAPVLWIVFRHGSHFSWAWPSAKWA
jgi:hypothetical protein